MPWKRDEWAGPACAAIKTACTGAGAVYQELLRFEGRDTYCCRCLQAQRPPGATCPAGWAPEEECPKLPYQCTTPDTGQYNEIVVPARW